MATEKPTGTKEWAPISKNIQMGCDNGDSCIYCYARARALRFKQIPDRGVWNRPVVNQKQLNERPKKLNGRIFFPSSHDITPRNIDAVVPYLERWLSVGNEFLIVSKPHLACIKVLCEELEPYKGQILFRFTIGATGLLRSLEFWEPGVPGFNERLASLSMAHGMGYDTSVSSEPFLDGTIYSLVRLCEPYVTDAHWVGKMNKMETRVAFRGVSFRDAGKNPSLWTGDEWLRWNMVKNSQTDDKIKELYEMFKHNPKIKYKDSIKEILGLPMPKGIGLDV